MVWLQIKEYFLWKLRDQPGQKTLSSFQEQPDRVHRLGKQSGATPIRITEALPPSPYGSFGGAPRRQQQVSARPAAGACAEQQVLHSEGQAGQQLQQEQLTAALEDLPSGEHVQGRQGQLPSEQHQRPAVQQAGPWLSPQQSPAGLQEPHAADQEGQQLELGQLQAAENAAQGSARGDSVAAHGAADASRANAASANDNASRANAASAVDDASRATAAGTAGSGLPGQAAAAEGHSESPLPEVLCRAQSWQQPPEGIAQPAEGHSTLPAAAARQQQVAEAERVALDAAQRDRPASAERAAAHPGPAEEASAEPLPPRWGQELGPQTLALGRASSPQQATIPGARQREPTPVEPASGDIMPLQESPSWVQEQAGPLGGTTPPSPQMAGPPGARLKRRQAGAPAPVDPASAEYRLAQERAAAARAACDLLRGRPKTSNEDPYFMDSYYRSVVFGMTKRLADLYCTQDLFTSCVRPLQLGLVVKGHNTSACTALIAVMVLKTAGS